MSNSSNDIAAERAAWAEAEYQAERERLRRCKMMTPLQRLQALESRGRVLARLRTQRSARAPAGQLPDSQNSEHGSELKS